uniref:ParB/Sulfiredoxin domain-containing protein n=1 Tax=viral metagenome TaxID=1070528 RepID=A0A6M3M3Z4_9ZZZZ
METEKMKISDLTYDPELYPRLGPMETAGVNWYLINQYANEMRAGAEFPPINIGIIDDESYPRHGKMLINDGVHRWKAYAKLGVEFVDVKVKHYDTELDFLKAATEPNVKHGRSIPYRDKARLLNLFREYDLEDDEISKLILVPMDKIAELEKRILKTEKGTRYLKPSVSKALEAGQITKEEAFAIKQQHIQTRTAEGMLKQLIDIVRGKALIPTEEIKRLSEELIGLLQEYF